MLAPRMRGAIFLDLFAGTGVNSLEALSRGAERALLIDSSPAAAAIIRRNFAALGVADARWELLVRPADRGLRALGERTARCDLGWCDPPFAEWDLGPAALVAAAAAGILAPDAEIVLELPPRRDANVAGFALARRLRGAVILTALD